MCDRAVDDCLAALRFVPDWFVTSKIIKKFFTTLQLIIQKKMVSKVMQKI